MAILANLAFVNSSRRSLRLVSGNMVKRTRCLFSNNISRTKSWTKFGFLISTRSSSITDSKFKSGTWIPVQLDVLDLENDILNVSFSYNQRTGSRIRRDQIHTLEYRGEIKNGFEIQLPNEDGAIKVYAIVKDTYNNVGIASTGIIVIDDTAKNRKYLVPKVSLPFYVYKDGEDDPYSASAYMGNYKVMTVDTKFKGDVYSGKASLKISYNQDYDWYGLGLVNPANDWGEILGGYDISGASKFSFCTTKPAAPLWPPYLVICSFTSSNKAFMLTPSMLLALPL